LSHLPASGRGLEAGPFWSSGQGRWGKRRSPPSWDWGRGRRSMIPTQKRSAR
jgi:hypothetical protein